MGKVLRFRSRAGHAFIVPTIPASMPPGYDPLHDPAAWESFVAAMFPIIAAMAKAELDESARLVERAEYITFVFPGIVPKPTEE
jgi:hypothetical protein